MGLEVAEQLGWSLPDHVVVPIASGALLTKVHQGFSVLAEHGLVEATRFSVHGAQSEGCPPVASAFADGRAGATVTVRPNIDALEEALAPVTPELLTPTG